MKDTKRKGFTIVELVIVIAVIAILAAVLIPTFVSITKKANQSADIQATRQMNTALITAAVDKEIKTVEDAAEALSKAGYNKELIPVSKDHSFYWYPKYNTIILINGEKELVFPTNNKEIVENYQKDLDICYNLALGNVKVEVTNAADLKEAFVDGDNVELQENITLTNLYTSGTVYNEVGRAYGLYVAEDEVVSFDLGGKTLNATDTTVAIAVEGELVLKNGTVISRGITVLPGGKLTIEEGVTITSTATDGGACIRNIGGIVIINGGTFNALNGDENEDIEKEPGCIYNNGKLIINGGTFNSKSWCYAIVSEGPLMEINKATINATRGAIAISSGSVVINGGTFNAEGAYSGHAVYFAGTEHSTLVINGGTFNGTTSGLDFEGVTDNR